MIFWNVNKLKKQGKFFFNAKKLEKKEIIFLECEQARKTRKLIFLNVKKVEK